MNYPLYIAFLIGAIGVVAAGLLKYHGSICNKLLFSTGILGIYMTVFAGSIKATSLYFFGSIVAFSVLSIGSIIEKNSSSDS